VVKGVERRQVRLDVGAAPREQERHARRDTELAQDRDEQDSLVFAVAVSALQYLGRVIGDDGRFAELEPLVPDACTDGGHGFLDLLLERLGRGGHAPRERLHRAALGPLIDELRVRPRHRRPGVPGR
jgi:hypothetical protein